jgi:hypothetical protein
MIDLNEHSTIADQVSVDYNGPGYYSCRTNRPLHDPVTLVKVAEEFMEKSEVYQFCKMNGYKIKPYLITCCSAIPPYWDINTGCFNDEELW